MNGSGINTARTSVALAALCITLIAWPMQTQMLHASGPLPSFEVATVRPCHLPPSPRPLPDGSVLKPVKIAPPGGGNRQVSDEVHFAGQTALLVALAYNVQIGTEKNYILGLPGWAESSTDCYKVDAKIDESLYAAIQKMPVAKQQEQVRLMEQSLLVDRFKLTLHSETRVLPVYSMVIAKGGPKLAPPKTGEQLWLTVVDTPKGSQLTARAATLDDWIQSPFLEGLDVVNDTGLHGAYDFTLQWTTAKAMLNATPESDADAPNLFTALQEQLGLRLVPTKAPVEVLVIDHIEQPTAN